MDEQIVKLNVLAVVQKMLYLETCYEKCLIARLQLPYILINKLKFTSKGMHAGSGI